MLCVRACVCVSACVCARVRVRARVCVCVRVCARARVCVVNERVPGATSSLSFLCALLLKICRVESDESWIRLPEDL